MAAIKYKVELTEAERSRLDEVSHEARVRCPGVSPAHPGTGYDAGHSAPLEPQGTRG